MFKILFCVDSFAWPYQVTSENDASPSKPEDVKWNRGCCNPRAGDPSCPTDHPQVVE